MPLDLEPIEETKLDLEPLDSLDLEQIVTLPQQAPPDPHESFWFNVGETLKEPGRAIARGLLGTERLIRFYAREATSPTPPDAEYERRLAEPVTPRDDLPEHLREGMESMRQMEVSRRKTTAAFQEGRRKEQTAALAVAHEAQGLVPKSAIMREFDEAPDDVKSVAKVFAKDPLSVIVNLMAESLPQSMGGMIVGGVLGSTTGSPVGTAIGAGSGSFIVEYGNAIMEGAQASGLDLTDPADVEEMFKDEHKMAEWKAQAVAYGAPVSAVDTVTAGLAGRFLKPALGQGRRAVTKAILKESGMQVAGGGAGDVAGRLASGMPQSAKSTLGEMLAELATTPGEIVSNVLPSRRDSIQARLRKAAVQEEEQEIDEKTVQDMSDALERMIVLEETADNLDAAGAPQTAAAVRETATVQIDPNAPTAEITPEQQSDFDKFLAETGRTAEEYRRASEVTEDLVPMPSEYQGRVEIKPSAIEGNGVFLKQPVAEGEIAAPILLDQNGLKRTPAGRFVNHAEDANSTMEVRDGMGVLVAKKSLAAGEELTVDYRETEAVAKQLKAIGKGKDAIQQESGEVLPDVQARPEQGAEEVPGAGRTGQVVETRTAKEEVKPRTLADDLGDLEATIAGLRERLVQQQIEPTETPNLQTEDKLPKLPKLPKRTKEGQLNDGGRTPAASTGVSAPKVPPQEATGESGTGAAGVAPSTAPLPAIAEPTTTKVVEGQAEKQAVQLVTDKAISAIESIEKKIGDGTYSDPFLLTVFGKLVLKLTKAALRAGRSLEVAIREAIAQARTQLPEDTTADETITQAVTDAVTGESSEQLPSGMTLRGEVHERAQTAKSTSVVSEHEYVRQQEKKRQESADQLLDRNPDNLEAAFTEAKQEDNPALRNVKLNAVLVRAMQRDNPLDPVHQSLIARISAAVQQEKTDAGQALQSNLQTNEALFPYLAALSWKNLLWRRQRDVITRSLDRMDTPKGSKDISPSSEASRLSQKVITYLKGDKPTWQGLARIMGIKKDSRSVQPGMEELIKLSKNGTLTEQTMFDALASLYGLEKTDGPTAIKLKDLTEKAVNAPRGLIRNRIYQQMQDTILDSQRVSPWNVLRDFWYASVLSGLRTHFAVLFGSGFHGFTFAVREAMDSAVLNRNLKDSIRILGQYIAGTGEGTLNLKEIVLTGDQSRLPDAEKRLIEFLGNIEKARGNTLEQFKRSNVPWKKLIGQMAYVHRLMVGLDYVGALATKDATMMYSALTSKDIEQIQFAQRRFDKAENKRATEQAKLELGDKAKLVDVLARKREILEEGISEETKEASIELARIAAANADPVGFYGAVYGAVKMLPFILNAPLGLAFARSASVMMQNATDWIPLAGAVNYGRAKARDIAWLDEWSNEHKRLGNVLFPAMTDQRKRMIVWAQITGLGVLATTAAYFLRPGDDDDRLFDLSGGWLGMTPDQRKQLLNAGERPMSLRVGKRWYSYKDTSLAGLLAIVGSLRDKQRFDPDEYAKLDATEKVVTGWLNGWAYVENISPLQGLVSIMQAGAHNQEVTPNTVNKMLAGSVGGFGAGFIPTMLKDMETWIHPESYRPERAMEYWIRNIPVARRTIGSGPTLNILGDPIELRRLPLSRFMSTESDDPAWQTIGSLAAQGRFLPAPSKTGSIVGRDGKRRQMNEKEFYEYQKLTGQKYRFIIEQNLDTLKSLSQEQWESFLDALSDSRETSRAQVALTE